MLIMVILKNLIKNNSYIECDYFPEGKNRCGHIKYDYINKKLIENECVKMEGRESYFFYAVQLLKRISTKRQFSEEFSSGKFREEYEAFWY